MDAGAQNMFMDILLITREMCCSVFLKKVQANFCLSMTRKIEQIYRSKLIAIA